MEIKFNAIKNNGSSAYRLNGTTYFFLGLSSNDNYWNGSASYIPNTDCIAKIRNIYGDNYNQSIYTYIGENSSNSVVNNSGKPTGVLEIGRRQGGNHPCYGWTIYYTKIWQDDELVFDGIPALDSNAKPCMYDLITKQPFYNKGSGEFLYG